MFVCPACGQRYDRAGYCAIDGQPLAETADPLLGTEIDRYRLTRLLGEGGMGRVYLAVQRAIGSRVAIKVLSDECRRTPELLERFFAEARAVNLISHENITSVLDMAVLPDGRPFIIMEFVEGQTLADIVRAGPAPIGGIVQVMSEVLSALAAAHAIGIVHRDLKPDNILITVEGHAKVLDFGIAKLAPGLRDVGPQTKTGAILGTPAYMAPEQISGAANVDARTDLYAVGVVLFEAVTGRQPFAGATLFDLMKAHVEQMPPPPRSLRPDLPEALEEVILVALAKDPAQRYQSATAMAQALAYAAGSLAQDQWKPLSSRGSSMTPRISAGGMGAQPTPQNTPRGRSGEASPSGVARTELDERMIPTRDERGGALRLRDGSQTPSGEARANSAWPPDGGVTPGGWPPADRQRPGPSDAPPHERGAFRSHATVPSRTEARHRRMGRSVAIVVAAMLAAGLTLVLVAKLGRDRSSDAVALAEPGSGSAPAPIATDVEKPPPAQAPPAPAQAPPVQEPPPAAPETPSKQPAKQPPKPPVVKPQQTPSPTVVNGGSAADHGVFIGSNVTVGPNVVIGSQTPPPSPQGATKSATRAADYDAKHFDPIAFLPKAEALAKELAPDAQLTRFEFDPVFADGHVDLTMAGRDHEYDFRSVERSARPAGTPRNIPVERPCMIHVEVEATRVVATVRTTEDCTAKLVRRPKCRFASVWKQARAAGTPDDLVARIAWLSDEQWFFDIDLEGKGGGVSSFPDRCP
jgi:serine/threonine protein kinase